MAIEVVFAAADGVRTFSYAPDQLGPSVVQALAASDWFPDGLPGELATSVWGHLVSLDTVLRDGDRLEITRVLQINPKMARTRRVDAKPRRGWMRRLRK
jgi:uncharacterized protein